MNKILFEDGKKVQEAYVTVEGKKYNVTPSEWQGTTPLSSLNLNNMQNNIDKAKVEKTTTIAGIDLQNNITTSELATALKTAIGNLMYPVGSIYLSIKNTNPKTLFGGTWVAWGTGRVPVGIDSNDEKFNSVEKAGGSNTTSISHTHSISGNTGGHTLTVNEIPAHKHTFQKTEGTTSAVMCDDGNKSTFGANISEHSGYNAKSCEMNNTGGGKAHTHPISVTTTSAGGNINIIQKYITCYMWKRTA